MNPVEFAHVASGMASSAVLLFELVCAMRRMLCPSSATSSQLPVAMNLHELISLMPTAAPMHAIMETLLRMLADHQKALEELKKTAEEQHNALAQEVLEIKQLAR